MILMRSPGSRSAAYAAALAERDIPCSFQESGDFFHTMEISVVMLSLLEIVDNPPPGRAADRRSSGHPCSASRRTGWRMIRRLPPGRLLRALVTADGGEDCKAFLAILSDLRQAGRDMSVHRLVWHIYNRLNVLGVFGAMDDGAARRENLIALSQHAEKFESNGYRGLFAFVTQLRRLLEQGQAPATRGPAEAAGVRLMSIHKSKGLEFPIVILADLDHAFSRQDFDTPVLVHPDMGLGPQAHRPGAENPVSHPGPAGHSGKAAAGEPGGGAADLVRGHDPAQGKADPGGRPLQRPRAACRSWPRWLPVPCCRRRWRPAGPLGLGSCCRCCAGQAAPLRALAGVELERLYEGDTAPWQVFCHDSEEFRTRPRPAASLETDKGTETFDPALLEFVYPYQRETLLPAKVTATQLKGRAAG